MRWYEKVIYEIGYFLMEKPPLLGTKLRHWALKQEWKRKFKE